MEKRANVYGYVCVCVHVYMCKYMCVSTHTYTQMCMGMCVRACMCVCKYMCASLCVWIDERAMNEHKIMNYATRS